MAQQTRVRTSLTGVALVRHIEALTDSRTRVSDARAGFVDGLVQWVGWADAIALSAALERPLATGGSCVLEFDGRAECDRVRTVVAQSLGRDVAAMDADIGYSLLRRRYVAHQQMLEERVNELRDRVRATLAARTPELARLAAVDAVMARALSDQERRLLASIPGLMEKHCRRMREDGGDEGEANVNWVKVFRQDMYSVLLAELDLRMQPVEGLIEALDEN